MDLVTFVERYTDFRGGVAQRDREQLSVLLPEDIGAPAEADFDLRDDPDPAGPGPLYPGHDVLRRLTEDALCRGRVLHRRLPETRTQRPGIDREARSRFQLRNARLNLDTPRRVELPWALFHYRVTVVWDEKRELMQTAAVDLQHNAPVDPSPLERVWLEVGRPRDGSLVGLEEAYRASLGQLEGQLEPRLKAFQRQSQRHLDVETGRLDEYYEKLLDDLRSRLRRASPDRRQALNAKIDQTLRDLAARQQDLAQKFRVRARARLSALEVVWIPRLVLPAEITRRGVKKRLDLTYNFLTHDFDPLQCQACRERGFNFYLCVEGHLTCPSCQAQCLDCGRRVCAGCGGMGACDQCGKRLCGACASKQPVCTTCRSDESATPKPAPPKPTPPTPPRARPGRAARSQRPAAGTRRKPASTPAPGPGVLIAAFYPFTDVYAGLEDLLSKPDSLVAVGKFREAAKRLRRIVRELDIEGLPDLHARFREVQSHLRRIPPDQMAEALLPRTGRPSAPPPLRNQAQQLLAGRRGLDRDAQELAIQILSRAEPTVSRSNKSPAGWAAAAYYLAHNTLSRYHLRQADVGDLFHVSAATVSQRCRDLESKLGLSTSSF